MRHWQSICLIWSIVLLMLAGCAAPPPTSPTAPTAPTTQQQSRATSHPAPSTTPTSPASETPAASPSGSPTREHTATPLPPTATPLPPTATPLPPTATPLPPPTTAPPSAGNGMDGYPTMPAGLQRGRVVRVVDGDTVDVELDGRVERLRLIGINTPETVDPRRPVECFGREASQRAKELLSGAQVFLEPDQTQDTRDKYDRLLVYVWMEDGRLFNLEMIAGGYAYEYTYGVPYKYQAIFKEVQRSAADAGSGLWSPQTCSGQTDAGPGGAPPDPGLQQPTAPPASGGGNCDPSYPDVCIPPPPPDLDCGDIPHRRFRVIGADPHRFDGNRDGVGCES